MASQGFLTEGGGLLKILYVGTRNTREALETAAFTKSNRVGNDQLAHNTTLADVNKLGVLAGSVVAAKGEGVVGAASGSTDAVLGVFVNDAAGNAYESSSAASSGKGVFVCGMGTYEVAIFETHDEIGTTSIINQYQYGKKLYASKNGLLTVAEGLVNGEAIFGTSNDSVIIGIITKAPTANDMILRYNQRV